MCRERDSNPHEHSSLPPQDSVSTSSTTSALIEGHNNYGKTQYICKKITDSLLMILVIIGFIDLVIEIDIFGHLILYIILQKDIIYLQH